MQHVSSIFFVFSHLLFGNEDKICVLIVSVHGHCLHFTFVMFKHSRQMGSVKSTPIFAYTKTNKQISSTIFPT